LQREFRGGARGDFLRRFGKALLHRLYRAIKLGGRDVSTDAPLEFGALAGVERGELLFPRGVNLLRALAGLAPAVADVRGDFERRIAPAQRLARAGDFLGAERRAVALLGARLGRRAETDLGPAG